MSRAGGVVKMPQAEILTIGDELLKGHVLNTNARFLGRQLTGLGFRVVGQSSCPDEIPAICSSVREALKRSRILILSGGLGPTPDDVTRDALAELFHSELEFSSQQYARISKYYKKRGKKVPPLVRREAMFPSNAVPLVNRYGIALGFYIQSGDALIFVLPGVPRELERMFHELVIPITVSHFGKLSVLHSLTAKIAGMSEPDIMQRLGKLFARPEFIFGIYPAPGEATIRIQSPDKTEIARLRRHIQKKIGSRVHSFHEGSFSESVGRVLTKRRKTLSLAESCTGGLISEQITAVPGSSRYFKGGVVAYSNEIKTKVLNVSASSLKKHGAVSSVTAKSMAEGVRALMKTDYAAGVTGIAGPDGGTAKKQVGLVYIALAGRNKVRVEECRFWGDRIQVRQKAAMKVLEMLWDELT